MKQIVGNRYFKNFCFASYKEVDLFAKSQNVESQLSLNETFGDYYYCVVCYHSLTQEKQFIITYSSDESDEKLNFLFWKSNLVLDTGKHIYMIDESLNIKSSFEITTPLIGLFLINKQKLLILEEAYLRIVDYKGQLVRSELFDLIEGFNIKDNLLFIQTSEENIAIELT